MSCLDIAWNLKKKSRWVLKQRTYGLKLNLGLTENVVIQTKLIESFKKENVSEEFSESEQMTINIYE